MTLNMLFLCACDHLGLNVFLFIGDYMRSLLLGYYSFVQGYLYI